MQTQRQKIPAEQKSEPLEETMVSAAPGLKWQRQNILHLIKLPNGGRPRTGVWIWQDLLRAADQKQYFVYKGSISPRDLQTRIWAMSVDAQVPLFHIFRLRRTTWGWFPPKNSQKVLAHRAPDKNEKNGKNKTATIVPERPNLKLNGQTTQPLQVLGKVAGSMGCSDL